MKILIVDDNVNKAGKLIKVFTEAHIARDDIELAVSAMAARSALKRLHFDLMVLDLLIPLREEDDPSTETAMNLIEEICERDAFKKPRHIVGFTAFPEAERAAISEFRRRLWTIVAYDETSINWQEEFTNLARYLIQAEELSRSHAYQVDLVVIAALQLELDAVLQLEWEWGEPEPLDDSTFVRHGRFFSNGIIYSVVAAACPRMGSVSAGLLSAKMIDRFRPRFIAMPGICAGVRGKAKISDVVIFDPVWEWPSGKIADDAKGNSYLQPSPDQIPLSEFLSARAKQMRPDAAAWNTLVPASVGLEEFPTIRVCPGASGSAVVADSHTVDSIQDQHRRVMAVEMEVYGVYAAARSSSRPRPTAFAGKSVCDFADSQKSDSYQAYCAAASALFLGMFFERYMNEIHELAGT